MSSQSRITRLHTTRRMSQSVVYNGVVYLSGQVASDIDADIVVQTQQVLQSIDSLLQESGSDKRNILMAQIYLFDIADVDDMNSVWDSWLPADCAPARATIESAMVSPDYLVEIVVTAAVSAANK